MKCMECCPRDPVLLFENFEYKDCSKMENVITIWKKFNVITNICLLECCNIYNSNTVSDVHHIYNRSVLFILFF